MERQVLRRSREGKSIYFLDALIVYSEWIVIQGTRGAKSYYRESLEKNVCVYLGEHRKTS